MFQIVMFERKYIYKEINFDNYLDEDMLLIINHINNVKWKLFCNKTLYELLSKKIREENIKN